MTWIQLWDWPCRGTPFTLHVITGWGVPLAEHLMSTFEPIILSWLSGSDTHSGGSGNTGSTRYQLTDEYHYKSETDHFHIHRNSYAIYVTWYKSPQMLHWQGYPWQTHRRHFSCVLSLHNLCQPSLYTHITLWLFLRFLIKRLTPA